MSQVRVVLDGNTIYPLESDKPVVIMVDHNNPVIVVTDGFHITKPLELVYHHLNTYYFKVECSLTDVQLIYGLVFCLMFVILGLASGFLFFQLLSFIPIIYILYLYYIDRKDFLAIRAM